MLDVSDDADDVMSSGGFTATWRIDSFLDGALLASDIPVSQGQETTDVTLNVPESLTLSVPREDAGTIWAPGRDVDHPLAPWGQRLHLFLGVGGGALGVELLERGWFYITDTQVNGDTVSVTASGLLGLIQEASFVSPFAPSGNFSTVLRRLVEPALTVDLTAAPTDRAVPSGIVWQDNRLDAVNELLDAWAAVAFVDETGTLIVTASGDTTTSSLKLTDGSGGTTMKWGGDLTRDGAANAVVARGNDSTGADVQAVVFDSARDSPTRYGGPFNPLPVPFLYYSPLLTTVGQCSAAAGTVLARRQKQAARLVVADAVPYLGLQARDGVTVTSDELGLDGVLAIVDRLVMPVTPASGAMTVGGRIPLVAS